VAKRADGERVVRWASLPHRSFLPQPSPKRLTSGLRRASGEMREYGHDCHLDIRKILEALAR
jgi:hypothetical protein